MSQTAGKSLATEEVVSGRLNEHEIGDFLDYLNLNPNDGSSKKRSSKTHSYDANFFRADFLNSIKIFNFSWMSRIRRRPTIQNTPLSGQ